MNKNSPTVDLSALENSSAPNEAPLTEAAVTFYDYATQLFAVKSLALFHTRGSDSAELVGIAGNTSNNCIKRLHSAAIAAISDAPDKDQNGILCLKIQSEGQPWGVMALDGPNTDTELKPLLGMATVFVENTLLKQRLTAHLTQQQPRLDSLAALFDIGQATHRLTTGGLLDLICEKAALVMRAQACSLMLKTSTDELVIKAAFGLLPEIVLKTRVPRGEGVAWNVAASGEPQLLNESESVQIGDVLIPGRSDIQSSMCVPLRGYEGRIFGVLSVRRMIPSPVFLPDDLRLFSLFADQAALAIASAELYANLNRRVEEMTLVNRLTTAINSTLDLEYVLSQIADCVTEVVGLDRCIVYLVDHRLGTLEARIVRGFTDAESYPKVVERGDSVVGLAAREQMVILAAGDHFRQPPASQAVSPAGSNAVIAAPIVVRKQTIGVIVADNQNSSRPVEQSQVELLSTFANHAGLAIENSRLYEAMEQKYAELNALYELSRTIGSAYGLDNAVDLLLEAALKAVPYESGAFALADEAQRTATVRAVKQTIPDSPIDWSTVEELDLAALILSLRDPRIISSTSDEIEPGEWQKAFSKVTASGHSLMLIPLIADGRTIGVLMLARPAGENFVSNDVKLLAIVSSHASVVIKNAATYERSVQEKVLELSALYEVSQRISTAASQTEALESILAITSDLVDCDECLIWTINPETGELELRASRWGERVEESDQAQPHIDMTLAAWAVRERKAVALPDIRLDGRFSSEELQDTRVRSLMSIPLMVQDDVAGVLTVHSYTPNLYTEDQVRILSVIASQAASIYRGLEALTTLTSYTDNILTSVPAGVVTLDTDGTVVSWNQAAEAILDIPAKAALGEDFFVLLHRLSIPNIDLDAVTEALAHVSASGDPQGGVRINARLDEERDIYLTLGISQLKDRDDEPLGIVIIFEDVTQQMQMQEEVRRMGELAAIGQLAASIAHELRNPLSSIKGAAQFLETESPDPSTREFLGIILEEVDGLNKIASEFLDFARPLKIETADVHVPDMMQKELSLLGPQLLDSNINAALEIEDIPTIQADQSQLEQVLLNLMLNSVQAMPEGGKLVLSARLSQRWPEHVELVVRDSGDGIAQERLSKIFTPFFTTKIKGTGLGLPVVQKIVQNHQGHIEVDSQEGEGSAFRIHLPIKGPRPSPLGEIQYSQPDLLERLT